MVILKTGGTFSERPRIADHLIFRTHGVRPSSLKAKLLIFILAFCFINNSSYSAPPLKMPRLAVPSLPTPPNSMRSPHEIELNGLERKVSLATGIGRIELRWTRDSERLFGRTPERATIEAANAVAKALKQSSFPSRLKFLNLNWNVIFLSKDLKAGQVPNILISNCHPGWMTPPSNIYIASEQAAGSCGGSPVAIGKVADAELTRVLIHEMGHAVEFALAPDIVIDRARSEGFATWFEAFAGRFSGLLDVASIRNEQKFLSRQKISGNYFSFNGSAQDYALASIIFNIIADERAISDLTRIYDLMGSAHLSFQQAISTVTGWSEKQIDENIIKYLNH